MRRLTVALAGVAITVVAVAGFSPSAGAASPAQQGWWTVANSGPAPGGLPGLAPPAPPDVPSNGLLIEGGAATASPIAFAALVYQLPTGATVGPLTLTVAPNSATTPATTLQVCPLTNPILIPEQGGPMADAPAYDCSHPATATASADGKSYQFKVSSFAAGGALAVAILPIASTDRVVFSQPGADSLAVQQSAGSTTETTTPAGGATEVPGQTPGAGALPDTGSSLSPTITNNQLPTSLTPSQAPSATTPSSPPSTQSGGKAFTTPPLAVSTTTAKANRAVVSLVLLGIAAAAALWAAAGRPGARSPAAHAHAHQELVL